MQIKMDPLIYSMSGLYYNLLNFNTVTRTNQRPWKVPWTENLIDDSLSPPHNVLYYISLLTKQVKKYFHNISTYQKWTSKQYWPLQ